MDAANSPSLLVMLLIMSAWLSAGDKAPVTSDDKSVDAGGPAAVRHLLHAFGMAYSKAAADGGWVLMTLIRHYAAVERLRGQRGSAGLIGFGRSQMTRVRFCVVLRGTAGARRQYPRIDLRGDAAGRSW